ncbi:MAG: hypothetical protein CBC29_07165 [Methylococcaceae bacterium TMED69]|nr:MAG: hypothetical protein CBC29_07165 [Methylococcaceae bacterium TMED69]|tara:strand:+ start:1509 stop:1715 length:207 start_codon:yes stop_codon:yes gene_type:complete
MKSPLIKAAILHFEAEQARAEANLGVYLKNSTGVAEHADLVEEVIKLTRSIAESEECIKVLKNIKEKK